jgi:hypothetical protein
VPFRAKTTAATMVTTTRAAAMTIQWRVDRALRLLLAGAAGDDLTVDVESDCACILASKLASSLGLVDMLPCRDPNPLASIREMPCQHIGQVANFVTDQVGDILQ